METQLLLSLLIVFVAVGYITGQAVQAVLRWRVGSCSSNCGCSAKKTSNSTIIPTLTVKRHR